MNRILKRIILFSLALQLLPLPAFSQSDISMATHWYNRGNYNPASIARNDYIYLFTNIRKQWLGVDGAPTVFNVQASELNYALHSAYGISLVSDQVGASQVLNPTLSYAYRLGHEEDRWLALGVSAGVFARNTDLSKLEAANQIDQTLFSTPANSVAPDATVGIEWHSPSWIAGSSVTHLLSVFKRPELYLNSTYTYGYLQYRNTNPQLFNYSFGTLLTHGNSLTNVELNSTVRIKHPTGLYGGPRELFDIGLSYNTSSVISLLLGTNITNNFRVGYAFIQSFSTGYNANSTHELMLEYRIPSRRASACHCHSESGWYY